MASANPADGGGKVLLDGWGVKEGSRFKTWKRRYFVLRTASKDGAVGAKSLHTHELQYYESDKRAASGAAPKGTVLLTRGETTVMLVTRKVGGKERPCLRVSTPGQRDFFFTPDDEKRVEWVKVVQMVTLRRAVAAAAAQPAPMPDIDAVEWPLLTAVLERSAASAPPQRRQCDTPGEGRGGPDAVAAAVAVRSPHPCLASAPRISSWPPGEEGAPPSLEATVRAVADEAAALRATRPDYPGVRRAVEAAGRAEASVGAAASGEGVGVGADAAESGRDVAAAVLSLQGVDWAKRVETALGKIDAQGAEFEEQLRHLREHGALPAEVQEVALEQLLDAVGALAATAQVLLLQAETDVKRGGYLGNIERVLRTELRKLVLAVTTVSRWGLKVPENLLGLGECELRSVPLAATDPNAVDGARRAATVQRVIGALVIAGGAATLKHVAWVDFDDKGEPVFEKFDRPLRNDPNNVEWTISRPPREFLDASECANLTTALRVYSKRATEATATLVPKVLSDVAAYADAKLMAMSRPNAKAALNELDDLRKQVPQPPCDQPVDWQPANRRDKWDPLKRAMELVIGSDADAPTPTALEHAVHKQQRAVAGSKRLYQLVSEVARGVEGHELVVLPGGVKKLARTVFKSAVNYGCDLSRITDQVRCTVVASTLGSVAAATRGLMDCETLSVVRVKNRFAEKYDATPAGGYVDLQTMVVFESAEGGWMMGEVQINLWSMLRIKENPEGGHKIFNFARAMRAYDAAMYVHKGGLDDAVAARIAAGVLVMVDFMERRWWEGSSALPALCRALTASECRVRELDLYGNAVGPSRMAALADALKWNNSVSKIDLTDNEIGASGAAALANALKCNNSISELSVMGNNIGDDGVVALADVLKHNASVSTLTLAENEIRDAGAAALADALTHNSTVYALYLTRNWISDAGAVALVNSIKCNTALVELSLDENWLRSASGAGIAALTDLSRSGREIYMSW